MNISHYLKNRVKYYILFLFIFFMYIILLIIFQGSNIFDNLNEEDYKLAMKLLEDAILSTDLALYFKYLLFKNDT